MFTQFANAACLALESNQVIWMRISGLYGLGPLETFTEIGLMVSEKTEAASAALADLVGGGTTDDVVTAYRDVVRANIKRLSA